MEEFKKELEDYFCRFTFGQFVTLILLEIVTLFFVFYLGAHYGPDLLGKKETEGDRVALRETSKSVDEIVGSPPVEYTYPEVLTGSGEGKAIKVKPSGLTAEEYERQGGEMVKPEQKQEQKPEKPAPLTEAVKEVPPDVPPIQEAENEVPQVKEKTTAEATGKFTIQVGSYQSAEEAKNTVSQWKKKGYTAFMTVGEIPDKGTWHRVRIGGFATRKEAEAFLEKFKATEKTAGLVVPSKS